MPGKHITDQQAKLYMNLRRTHTREIAAAKAGFSASTGCAARCRSPTALPEAARRAAGGVPIRWPRTGTSEIVPMLRAIPGLRPITVLREMQRRHAGLLR